MTDLQTLRARGRHVFRGAASGRGVAVDSGPADTGGPLSCPVRRGGEDRIEAIVVVVLQMSCLVWPRAVLRKVDHCNFVDQIAKVESSSRK